VFTGALTQISHKNAAIAAYWAVPEAASFEPLKMVGASDIHISLTG
jgi:hypothetical protein